MLGVMATPSTLGGKATEHFSAESQSAVGSGTLSASVDFDSLKISEEAEPLRFRIRYRYRRHHGHPKRNEVAKSDVGGWLRYRLSAICGQIAFSVVTICV